SLLEDLIAMLSEIEPKYGKIFRLLYDGATQKEMADKLNLKQRTVSDYVKKIRAIVQSLVKDTFDR
ncbi:MAG: LuxR C-terminal-related transcriptional regulator, partial [Bacteroides ovatus]|nr:LuxR C-terminal-related transcriptional regulator [Bacteroides ovatus]